MKESEDGPFSHRMLAINLSLSRKWGLQAETRGLHANNDYE